MSSPYGSGYPGAPEYRPSPKVRFEAIGEAWQLFTQQMGTWVLALLILLGLIFVVYLVFVMVLFGALFATAGTSRNGDPGAALGLILLGYPIMFLVMLAIASYMTSGLMRMAINQVRGAPISLNDLFKGGDVFLPVLGATLLVALATALAGVFFVIPAYIVAGLFFLTIPLVIDQRMGVTQAMTASWNALKSDWITATLFAFVLSLVAGLGGVACGVGALFTLPLFYLGTAIVYRDFFIVQQAPQYSPNLPYPPPAGPGYPPPAQTTYPPAPTSSYAPPTGVTYPPTTEIEAPPIQASAPPVEAYETPVTPAELSFDTDVSPVEASAPPMESQTPTVEASTAPIEVNETPVEIQEVASTESFDLPTAEETETPPEDTDESPPSAPSKE